jgi:hypothetical protein
MLHCDRLASSHKSALPLYGEGEFNYERTSELQTVLNEVKRVLV